MDESILEIREYKGEGFQPLIFFGTWRVAILRYTEELSTGQIDAMERHLETDEVFVLLEGHAILILGDNSAQVEDIQSQVMEPGKLYNVKLNAWHTVLMSRDASILLVENGDTGKMNSEYTDISPEHRRQLQELAQTKLPGMHP